MTAKPKVNNPIDYELAELQIKRILEFILVLLILFTVLYFFARPAIAGQPEPEMWLRLKAAIF